MGDSGSDVAFSYVASPGDLPGGNTIDPAFAVSNVAIFTADADAGNGGAVSHGINAASEWLTMSYTLNSGMTYANVVNDLATGRLRIGMHVTGLDQAAMGVPSTSYVNNRPAHVPVPAAVWLLGSGLIGMVGVARRKQTPKCLRFWCGVYPLGCLFGVRKQPFFYVSSEFRIRARQSTLRVA
jgi:hypothetical protein